MRQKLPHFDSLYLQTPLTSKLIFPFFPPISVENTLFLKAICHFSLDLLPSSSLRELLSQVVSFPSAAVNFCFSLPFLLSISKYLIS